MNLYAARLQGQRDSACANAQLQSRGKGGFETRPYGNA